MPISPFRLIKWCAIFERQADLGIVPRYTRGIYVLLKHRPRVDAYDVVYVGLAGGPHAGIRGRLRSHARRKANLWTHFSVFAVWDNVRSEEVAELESLFRSIYSRDSRANRLNVQKGSKRLKSITHKLCDKGRAGSSEWHKVSTNSQ